MEKRKIQGLPIQIKYSVLLTMISGFMLLTMIFVMAWFIQRNYNLFMGDELGVSSQVVQIVRREQELLERTLFILFCVGITVIFTSAFYVVRRLTGPMVALERQLWQYVRGDWTHRFRLRKNDEYKELEMLVNQLRLSVIGQDKKVAEKA